MSALAARRRRRTLIALAVGVVASALLPVLGWVAADALRSSEEGRDALEGLQPIVRLPPTPTALLAALDDQDRVAGLAVFALAPPVDGVAAGGTVVVVPAGGDTFLPDGTRGRVADAYAQGGLDALVTAAEGLLGITFSQSAALHAADLEAMFAGLGTVELNLDRAVLADTAGSDTPEEVFPPGPLVVDAAGLAELLTSWSTSESELDRLPRHDAVWRAVSARVGTGLSVTLPAAADPADQAPALVEDVFAGRLQVHTLEARLVTDENANPDRLDLLSLSAGEITVVFATVAPSAVSPLNPTISIYVRSPLGDPALTRQAVETLILAGANVVLVTENPELTTAAETEVAWVDANDQPESERFAEQLGTFTSLQSEVRIDGIDAIVTLGASYRTENAGTGVTTSTDPGAAGTETTTG